MFFTSEYFRFCLYFNDLKSHRKDRQTEQQVAMEVQHWDDFYSVVVVVPEEDPVGDSPSGDVHIEVAAVKKAS